MSIRDQIEALLRQSLQPLHLVIVDDSAAHAGHAGSRPGGETHFTVEVVADIFTGESRLSRQRRVNDALRALLAGPVHALSIRALTPDEWAARRAAAEPQQPV
jgi:BolA protein